MQGQKKSLEAKATVRGEMLVVSLPDAVTPVLWQFDLSSVKASALEVTVDGAGQYILRLKTPRGEIHDIGAYLSRDTAVDVLTIVHQALVCRTEPEGTGPVPQMEKKSLHIPLVVSVVIILVALFWLFTVLVPAPRTMSLASVTAGPVGAASIKSGAPVSADDVLNGGLN